MRMWMIDPTVMCRKHLLGEHSEIHKHLHNFIKKHNMHGRLKAPAQIVPHRMQQRHDALVEEMLARGYKHQSPYQQPDVGHLPIVEADLLHNVQDLVGRCTECAKRMNL